MFGAVAVNDEPSGLSAYAKAIEHDVLALSGVARLRRGFLRRFFGGPAVRVRMDGQQRLFISMVLVLHFGAPAPETGFEVISVVRQSVKRIAGEQTIGKIHVSIGGFDLTRFDRDMLRG